MASAAVAPAPAPAPAPAGFLSDGQSFFKFPSFDAAHRVEALKRLAPAVCSEAEWVAVEKIHGANFSVTFGEGVEEGVFASRSNYLSEGFFNHTGKTPLCAVLCTPLLCSAFSSARHGFEADSGLVVLVLCALVFLKS